MKLYHGTSESRLPAILRDGLKPRGRKKGNWGHSIESCADAVYLTEAYALYYAYSATNVDVKTDRLVVLEIDTDKLDIWAFAPDEDWLEQTSRKQSGKGLAPIAKPMLYRTKFYRQRLMNFSQHWRDSLKGLGNCTYHGTIPAKAITRIAFVDQKTNADLMFAGGLDPTISLMNYAFCGAKYRASMKKLFGEAIEEEDDGFSAQMRWTPEQIAQRDAYLAEVWGRVEVRVQ